MPLATVPTVITPTVVAIRAEATASTRNDRCVVVTGRTVVVCGPPCSGKSTYVLEHMADGETVLDYDLILAETGDRVRADAQFRRQLEGFTTGWIIRGAPRKQHRAVLRRIHRAKTVVLAVSADECIARLRASDRSEQVRLEQEQAIHRWWAEYEPSDKDLLIGVGAAVTSREW